MNKKTSERKAVKGSFAAREEIPANCRHRVGGLFPPGDTGFLNYMTRKKTRCENLFLPQNNGEKSVSFCKTLYGGSEDFRSSLDAEHTGVDRHMVIIVFPPATARVEIIIGSAALIGFIDEIQRTPF